MGGGRRNFIGRDDGVDLVQVCIADNLEKSACVYRRRLLGISYMLQMKKRGTESGKRFGPYEDLLTTVNKRKLRWYGHITRSTGLAKMILQGSVQGGRRKGRQKKRWEDNVTEWTGLKLGEALRKAENREGWRKVVAQLSLAPQRSTRLRDKSSEV